MSRTLRTGRAFTLIELLVVIFIIGLLAAISLPVMSSVRDSAQRTRCASNLRQLGVAVRLYLQYNEDCYFPYYQSTSEGRLWYFGLERNFGAGVPEGSRALDVTRSYLYPYFGAAHTIELCPSFRYVLSSYKAKFAGASFGYGYNVQGLAKKPAGQITRPSEIVLFADAAQVNTFQAPASPSKPMVEEFYYVSPTEKTVHFRHGGLANVLFCDGHIEAMRPAPGSLDTRMRRCNIGRLNVLGDKSMFLP